MSNSSDSCRHVSSDEIVRKHDTRTLFHCCLVHHTAHNVSGIDVKPKGVWNFVKKMMKMFQCNASGSKREENDGNDTENEQIENVKRDLYPSNNMCYDIDTDPRGICIIINNDRFQNMPNRDGSFNDANALETLFGRDLNFVVNRKNNLNVLQIQVLLETIRSIDHSKMSCFILCVLSHGNGSEFYGTDGSLIGIDTMMNYFCSTNCTSLIGKPKVFLLQFCRGMQKDAGFRNADEIDHFSNDFVDGKHANFGCDKWRVSGSIPDKADFLMAFATTSGHVSWRNNTFGSWYIKAFVDTMYKLANKDHLVDILTEVNRIVAENFESTTKYKQMPAPVNMLRYKLFMPLHSRDVGSAKSEDVFLTNRLKGKKKSD